VYDIVVSHALRSLGVDIAPSDTPRELVKKVEAAASPETAGVFKQLADLAEKVAYAKPADDNDAALAIELGEKIIENLCRGG
jgi:hypothetical protein